MTHNPYEKIYDELNITITEQTTFQEAQKLAIHLGLIYNTFGIVVKDLINVLGYKFKSQISTNHFKNSRKDKKSSQETEKCDKKNRQIYDRSYNNKLQLEGKNKNHPPTRLIKQIQNYSNPLKKNSPSNQLILKNKLLKLKQLRSSNQRQDKRIERGNQEIPDQRDSNSNNRPFSLKKKKFQNIIDISSQDEQKQQEDSQSQQHPIMRKTRGQLRVLQSNRISNQPKKQISKEQQKSKIKRGRGRPRIHDKSSSNKSGSQEENRSGKRQYPFDPFQIVYNVPYKSSNKSDQQQDYTNSKSKKHQKFDKIEQKNRQKGINDIKNGGNTYYKSSSFINKVVSAYQNEKNKIKSRIQDLEREYDEVKNRQEQQKYAQGKQQQQFSQQYMVQHQQQQSIDSRVQDQDYLDGLYMMRNQNENQQQDNSMNNWRKNKLNSNGQLQQGNHRYEEKSMKQNYLNKLNQSIQKQFQQNFKMGQEDEQEEYIDEKQYLINQQDYYVQAHDQGQQEENLEQLEEELQQNNDEKYNADQNYNYGEYRNVEEEERQIQTTNHQQVEKNSKQGDHNTNKQARINEMTPQDRDQLVISEFNKSFDEYQKLDQYQKVIFQSSVINRNNNPSSQIQPQVQKQVEKSELKNSEIIPEDGTQKENFPRNQNNNDQYDEYQMLLLQGEKPNAIQKVNYNNSVDQSNSILVEDNSVMPKYNAVNPNNNDDAVIADSNEILRNKISMHHQKLSNNITMQSQRKVPSSQNKFGINLKSNNYQFSKDNENQQVLKVLQDFQSQQFSQRQSSDNRSLHTKNVQKSNISSSINMYKHKQNQSFIQNRQNSIYHSLKNASANKITHENNSQQNPQHRYSQYGQNGIGNSQKHSLSSKHSPSSKQSVYSQGPLMSKKQKEQRYQEICMPEYKSNRMKINSNSINEGKFTTYDNKNNSNGLKDQNNSNNYRQNGNTLNKGLASLSSNGDFIKKKKEIQVIELEE